MNRIQHTKSSLFLMELIINIFFFSILLVISLQFFVNSRNLSKSSTELQRAVTICSNVAAVYQSGDGTTTTLLDYYPEAVNTESQIFLFYDSNFLECHVDDAVYYVSVNAKSNVPEAGTLTAIEIQCFPVDGECIYQLTVPFYTQLTPGSMKGGDSNE